MSGEQFLRPELILGPNPLIEALPPFLSTREMAKAFGNYPLARIDWRSIPPDRREPLLEIANSHVVPTSIALPVAMAIQQLVRRSMNQRNPLKMDERTRCNTIGVATTIEKIRSVARLDAAASTIEGMTGMGKTTIANRALQLIAPNQVIDHGRSKVCGWERLVQVVWLYVDHPSNGSRGALLKRILSAMDEALGTDYSTQFIRVVNIDSLLTQVCKVLTLHRVALLIIDEKQERNFEESPWNIEFVLFYLSLMNLGISVLLIGNPLAFEHFRSFSQVVRRFSTGGMHRLDPATEEQEPWWAQDFVPRLHRFTLVEEVAISESERLSFEFANSAGIPGLLQLLHVESMRNALRQASGNQAKLTIDDLKAVTLSPNFAVAAKIAQQVLDRTSVDDVMTDVPYGPEGAHGKSVNRPFSIETLKRMTKSFHAAQSREHTLFRKRLDTLSELSPDELQILGVQTELLDEVRKAAAASKISQKSK